MICTCEAFAEVLYIYHEFVSCRVRPLTPTYALQEAPCPVLPILL